MTSGGGAPEALALALSPLLQPLRFLSRAGWSRKWPVNSGRCRSGSNSTALKSASAAISPGAYAGA